jgi:intracellular septation protein A
MTETPPPPPPPSPRAALFWSLAPLLVFYLVEDQWGTTAALVASMLFTLGDLAITWLRQKRLDRVALFTGGLVLGLGGLSLLSDDERFMLYTPVASDALFALLLGVSVWRKRPLMLVLAEQQQPDLAADPLRRDFLGGMTLRLALNLATHGLVTAWSVSQPRETWLFVSGPLQYLMLGLQFLFEIAWGRHRLPPEPEESTGDPPTGS